MGKKYTIELERGETAYKTVDSNGTPLIQLLAPTPYTEPNLERVRKEAYQNGYETGYEDGYNEPGKNQQEAYQRGLNDAWDAARKTADYWMHCRSVELFNTPDIIKIFEDKTASEAIEKIRQYEQEQDGLRQNIQTIVDKCGYSLDEIATVLKKMRGEQDG